MKALYETLQDTINNLRTKELYIFIDGETENGVGPFFIAPYRTSKQHWDYFDTLDSGMSEVIKDQLRKFHGNLSNAYIVIQQKDDSYIVYDVIPDREALSTWLRKGLDHSGAIKYLDDFDWKENPSYYIYK